MYRTVAAIILLLAAPLAHAGEPVTMGDLKEHETQMKKAQQMLNSPAYQEQMQKAMQQMKAQGMDTSQMPAGMEAMRQMNGKAVEAAMGMNACLQEKIGEEGMNRIAEQGEAQAKKIKALCDAGKRAEAEAAAQDYAKEMMGTKEYQVMKTCVDKYKAQMDAPSMAKMRKQLQSMQGDHGKQKSACG